MAMASVSLVTMAQVNLGSGLHTENFDKTVRPGDDFYEYACGGWMKNNPLPAAYSRYGSFDRLQEDNDKRINGILKELQSNTYEKGTIEQKLSDLYKLAMASFISAFSSAVAVRCRSCRSRGAEGRLALGGSRA